MATWSHRINVWHYYYNREIRCTEEIPPSAPSMSYTLHVFERILAASLSRTVSELSFKWEKQHLISTPTLGSALRAQSVSSEGFSEANKTVRESGCGYDSSLLDSHKHWTSAATLVLARGELTPGRSRAGPSSGKQRRGQGGNLKRAQSYYILTGAGWPICCKEETEASCLGCGQRWAVSQYHCLSSSSRIVLWQRHCLYKIKSSCMMTFILYSCRHWCLNKDPMLMSCIMGKNISVSAASIFYFFSFKAPLMEANKLKLNDVNYSNYRPCNPFTAVILLIITPSSAS